MESDLVPVVLSQVLANNDWVTAVLSQVLVENILVPGPGGEGSGPSCPIPGRGPYNSI